MLTLLAVIHILIALGVVLFVLLQDPKGGAMGVFSGGSSSSSFFGASGASNFLTTATKWLAVLFAISCMVLTYLTSNRGSSVMDNAAPAAAPAAQPSATPTGAQQSLPNTNQADEVQKDTKPNEQPKQ